MQSKAIRKPSFFFILSIVGLLAAMIGFGKTFFLPVAAGTFSAPPAIHVHGAFAFAWIILFVIQTSLIHFRKYRIHSLLGIVGFFIAAGVMITMIPAGVYVVQKELARGQQEGAYSGLLGVITSGLLYLGLVIAGIANRYNPASHKRLMLLATIVVLWPAWFRFRHYFPSVPRPEIWFALMLADSLIVIAWIWDKWTNDRVNPVLLYVGIFIILEQCLEVMLFDNSTWRIVSKSIYDFI